MKPTEESYKVRLENASRHLHETAMWHPHPWLRDLAAMKATQVDQKLIDASFVFEARR